MKQHFVRRLDGTGAHVGEVGGKAASLDRLVALNFPVPPAVVLTADAFRAFVSGSGLGPFLETLRRGELPSPDAIEAETLAVDQAFLHAPMPEALAEAIRDAARPLVSAGPV
ncbi:MAG: PEP/pyruvate-binding domain-containing protein, partial [Actinomycetota bacterium]